MRALEFITGHVIYNPAYTYKFQLKTTNAIQSNFMQTGNFFSLLQVCFSSFPFGKCYQNCSDLLLKFEAEG
jgi:hypothetical protein